MKQVTLQEVRTHDQRDDAWIIYKDLVYDVSEFANRHPGGKVILLYRGQDATDVMRELHPNLEKNEKIMKKFLVGELSDPPMLDPIMQDFRKLRKDFEKEGLFKPNKMFYVMQLLQCLLLEIAGFTVYSMYPESWYAFFVAVLLLGTAQIQAGWSQHDYGHFSVFQNFNWDKRFHHFTVGFLKGASSGWWQFRHNRHHSKTNVIKKDPDIHNWPLFLFGEDLGEIKKFGWAGTKFQHFYWWLFGPPMVTTLLFFYQILDFLIKKKPLIDWLMVIGFVIRYYLFGKFYIGITGWAVMRLYWCTRLFESHWFTWVTSMSHLPMKIEYDQDYNWCTLHVTTTQNVESSTFNDWFSGHLNFQIEHHLIPQMPRHNYHKIAPRIEAMYKKHGIKVHKKSMWDAFASVYDSLEVNATEYVQETTKSK